VIIFAYGIVKCLSGKTFRAIFTFSEAQSSRGRNYQYRPRFHTETRRAKFPILSLNLVQLNQITWSR